MPNSEEIGQQLSAPSLLAHGILGRTSSLPRCNSTAQLPASMEPGQVLSGILMGSSHMGNSCFLSQCVALECIWPIAPQRPGTFSSVDTWMRISYRRLFLVRINLQRQRWLLRTIEWMLIIASGYAFVAHVTLNRQHWWLSRYGTSFELVRLAVVAPWASTAIYHRLVCCD